MTTKSACSELSETGRGGGVLDVPAPAARNVPPERGPEHRALSTSEAQRLFGPVGLAAALEARHWVELWPGVVLPADAVEDLPARAAAALVLAGPGAVLSRSTAAAVHGYGGPVERVVHVTVGYDRRIRSGPGLSVHQARIRESDVLELDGLRVQALDVALAEMLCKGPQRLALACLEQALAGMRADQGRHLRALVAERVARRVDRRGTRQAAGLLELASDGLGHGCSERAAVGHGAPVAG